MTATMTEARRWEVLKAEDYHPTAFLAFADWLEEGGDPRAAGARWVGEEG